MSKKTATPESGSVAAKPAKSAKTAAAAKTVKSAKVVPTKMPLAELAALRAAEAAASTPVKAKKEAKPATKAAKPAKAAESAKPAKTAKPSKTTKPVKATKATQATKVTKVAKVAITDKPWAIPALANAPAGVPDTVVAEVEPTAKAAGTKRAYKGIRLAPHLGAVRETPAPVAAVAVEAVSVPEPEVVVQEVPAEMPKPVAASRASAPQGKPATVAPKRKRSGFRSVWIALSLVAVAFASFLLAQHDETGDIAPAPVAAVQTPPAAGPYGEPMPQTPYPVVYRSPNGTAVYANAPYGGARYDYRTPPAPQAGQPYVR